MMILRKSQTNAPVVSFFMIVAVAIIIAVLVTLNFVSNSKNSSTEQIPSFTSAESMQSYFESYIENCLKDSTISSIRMVSLLGGQSRLKVTRDAPSPGYPLGKAYPQYYKIGSMFITESYIYNNLTNSWTNQSYTTLQLQEQLADRINLTIPYCFAGFSSFMNAGMRIKLMSSKTEVSFLEHNYTNARYDFDAFLEMENKSVRINRRFDYKVKNDLLLFKNSVDKLMSYMNGGMADNNTFPEFYLMNISRMQGFYINRTLLDKSRVALTLIKNNAIDDPMISSKNMTFNTILKFNWNYYKNLNYSDSSLTPSSIALIDTKEFVIDSRDYPYRTMNYSSFSWDISTYFPNYDKFIIYSDIFSVNYNTGLVTVNEIYPELGEREFVINALKSTNPLDVAYGKFKVNIQGPSTEVPSVTSFSSDDAIKGFDYYKRVWAVGSQDRVPYFTMSIPDSLKNMPCNGYIYIDNSTGEIVGYITAVAGTYPITVTAYQYMEDMSVKSTSFNYNLNVIGNYTLGCEG